MSRSRETNYFNNAFDLPNLGLESYFGNVRRGQPDEYRTPFYEGKSLELILDEWNNQLESIKTDWPTLYEFEIDLRDKVGPLSIMKPLAERMNDIRSYYELISLPQAPIAEKALKATRAEWGHVRGMEIRSAGKTMEAMKKSTNSGSPFFTKRRSVQNETEQASVFIDGDEVRQFLPNCSRKNWDACAILGWRGQEGGLDDNDVKQRVVWMFPFAVNLCELQVYQPMILGAQRANIVPAWVSMDAVDQRITRLFDTKAGSDLIICTDFSKFDQHFNETLQGAARWLLESIFNGSEKFAEWLDEVFPIKYMIPLAYDMGKIMFGKHGMGSGSGGTNADETLVHRALQFEAAILDDAKLNPFSQCLGDDGILSYPGCSAEAVLRSYQSHGLEMNPDKQYVSTQDCTYLRRWHHTKYRVNDVCVGVYSTMRALGRLCEQERFYSHWSKEMVALRQLSILENVKWHPLREEFATYCMKGDKYRLGLDIPGFFDKLRLEVVRANDYMPDFLGYTKSNQVGVGPETGFGIESWWIVNYLKSLA